MPCQWVWLPLAHAHISLRVSYSRRWRSGGQEAGGSEGLCLYLGAGSSEWVAAQLSLCLGELTAQCLGSAYAAGWSDVFTSDLARKDSSCFVTGAHILQMTEAHPTAHRCPIPLEPDTSDMCHSSLGFSIRATPIFIISCGFLLSYCCGEFGDRGQIWDRNVG